MLETKELRVRVNDVQYNYVKTKAQLSGYNTISAYIRDRLIKTSFITEKYVIEIYEALLRRSQ